MKYFDTYLIERHIDAHKRQICCVLCGYTEVWLHTARVVFCNGNYTTDFATLNSRIPNGTTRTPYMVVILNDGSIQSIPCYRL